jgi:LPS sulfotransferase NodH
VTAVRSYIIAATPRTGSWLLCDCLRQAGVAGRPAEYGVRGDEATWRRFYGFGSHRAYFDRLIPLHATPNGVFGLKLMWWQLTGLAADASDYLGARPSPLDAIADLAGPVSFIWMRRRDRLRQAVSWVRAEQTQRWSSQQAEGAEGSEPAYDAESIASALGRIEQQEMRWESLLSSQGADPLPVFYEDFCRDVTGGLARVLRFLGLEFDLEANPIRPRLQKQAGSSSQTWVRRARADLSARPGDAAAARP